MSAFRSGFRARSQPTASRLEAHRGRSWRKLRKLLRTALAMVAAVLALGIVSAPLASADSNDDSITRYDVDATLRADGSLQVNLDFDFNFGSDSGHGPYLVLPERMRIPGDPDHWRELPIHNITASSTDAPANVDVQRDSGTVEIKVGNANKEVRGTHTYRVSYLMDGAVNPNAKGSGLDELSWNAVGNQWQIPLRNITVRVTAPVAIQRVACFTGSSYSTPCSTKPTSSGESATFRPGVNLQPGQGLQVVAAMPAGSFPCVHPIITERYGPARMFGLTAVSFATAGVVLLAGLAAAIGWVRRTGANLRFTGIAPGQLPDGGTGPVERDPGHPIAVRFEPPAGVSPGQVGVLMDARAGQQDVTATVIDLATRGYLRVEELYYDDQGDPIPVQPPSSPDDPSAEDLGVPDSWQLVALDKSRADLQPFERDLLGDLFTDDQTVELDSGTIVSASGACQKALYLDAAVRLGWFRGRPNAVRARRALIGFGLLVLGLAAFLVLGVTLSLGFVGVAIGLVGFAMLIMSARTPGRTAVGTAVHDQALGFKEYLATAEADQIRFEEGLDIFSRYLPYAMIWGLADRWTKIFAELAARGVDLPTPTWYVGITSPYVYADGAFANAMGDFGSTATSAMTSASSGSGGGSGFSGGGGIGGGGGGGW